ncbi:MAG: hypothetical protein QOG91_326, partial [Candidatus Parcubacteria bacterium]|nr:hypothetical protein [Candidatus Parcubacteria bacterium]
MYQGINPKKWVVYVSTFPPRECGIATFTEDLMNSFDEMYNPREEAKVIAVNPDATSKYMYDRRKVLYQIPQQEADAYVRAAQYLNSLDQVALVHVEHEFGIFGGPNGSHLIFFLRELRKPAVITFHSVLPEPNPDLRDTVRAINNHVQSIVAMTETSKRILIEEYGINPEKIAVIPHGIHPVNFSDGSEVRRSFGVNDRLVISTFGLLGKGKGIEYGIEAMAEVIRHHPEALYLIVGATHPTVLKNEGESYRNSLIQKVRELKLENHVFFYNNYLEIDDLLRVLDATHIYLALSQDPHQAVSGTLSYALGSGRPVVSTPFAQAREDVTPDVGRLVGFTDPAATAAALIALARDRALRNALGKNAFFKTRGRIWSNVMLSHMSEYIRLVPDLSEVEKNLPKIKLSHLFKLTDGFGVIQFAKLLVPDPGSGYTTDDTARALIALVKYYEVSGRKSALPLIQTYLNFIEHVQRESGGFHNYVDIEKKIPRDQHVKENLEGTSARGLYALSITAVSEHVPSQLRERAADLFRKHVHIAGTVTAPRSMAFAIKALSAWTKAYSFPAVSGQITKMADELVTRFETTSAPNWKWFEDILAYSNGIMSESLIEAYIATRNEKYLTVARESLDFLIHYSFEGPVCMPIGQNGWLKRGGKKHNHDQQPEEVATLISALKAMHAVTRDNKYARRMRDAFNWFLGNNSLRRIVYDHATGGCYDGVGEKEINLNQGAESTIMYLLARLEFERAKMPAFHWGVLKDARNA